jgi:hypothetical protein
MTNDSNKDRTGPNPRPLSESDFQKSGDPKNSIPNKTTMNGDPRCSIEDMQIPVESTERQNQNSSAMPNNELRIQQLEQQLQRFLDASTSAARQPSQDTHNSLSIEERITNLETSITEISNANTGNINKLNSVKTNQTRPQKRKYVPITDDIPQLEHFKRFYEIKFDLQDKRCINPYTLKKEITKITGQTPKQITTSGADAFTVEIRDASQGKNIIKLKSVNGKECKCSTHQYLNNSKGIIYIHEFDIDDGSEFAEGLMENYNISKVEEANFIKPRNPQTKVFLLTFDQETVPESIYIPGERSDTRVFPFVNKPKLCRNCQNYGHNSARCNKELRCKNCSQNHHTNENCNNDVFCMHCNGNHQIGNYTCPKQIEEKQIILIQDQQKVGRRRARQIYDGNTETVTRPAEAFASHFRCSIDESEKRKITPWLMQKHVETHLGSKPKCIRSGGKNSFIIEVMNKQQSKDIINMKKIEKLPVLIEAHQHSLSKGLIYIYEYNLDFFEDFKSGLINDYNLHDAQIANWIKPRNPYAKPILITFNERNSPEFIEIAGEQSKTKVYEYISSPMVCAKCLDFGHPIKYCKNNTYICLRCNEPGHSIADCQSSILKCHHCGGDHQTKSNKCPEYKYEKEIQIIQTREKISRQQARINLNKTNPNLKMNFAKITKQQMPTNQSAIKERSNTVSNSLSLEVRNTQQENRKVNPNKRSRDDDNNQENGIEQHEVVEPPNKIISTTTNGTKPKKPNTAEAVCISPGSGKMFTTTVQLDHEQLMSDCDNQTSENNPEIRNQAKYIFKSYRKKISTTTIENKENESRNRSRSRRNYRDRKDESPPSRSAERSRSRHRSRTRSSRSTNKKQTDRKEYPSRSRERHH